MNESIASPTPAISSSDSGEVIPALADEEIYIAGIGASAGGLEAITQLIRYLRPDLPYAYVILQHLSPSHRSMMVEILSRETHMPVKEAEDGDLPIHGTLYVVPSNSNASIKDGRICLAAAPPEVVPKPSINHFLVSLAAERGESAIGIVLSGTGSDGTSGLRAIQAAGGYTFAQRPESAKYDGMPRSAIEAGVVDQILSPEEIASSLLALFESVLPEKRGDIRPDLLERLLGAIKDKLNSDFSGYKTSTLTRRIRRREIATGCRDLAEYLDWVENHPEEIDKLAKDILISVTAFFRDREAFDALEETAREICRQKAPGSEIRVWVSGCATGEEAYSIAMIFANVLGAQLPEYRIQIFATDLDDDALNFARRGIYPAALMNQVSGQDLERYFRPVGHSFEAGKTLRDMIVFARHNLVSDRSKNGSRSGWDIVGHGTTNRSSGFSRCASSSSMPEFDAVCLLRESIMPLHRQLEEKDTFSRLLRPDVAISDYAAALKVLFRFLSTFEDKLISLLGSTIFSPLYRSRLPLLLADLHALNEMPLDVVDPPFSLSSVDEAYGLVYVMEGSSGGSAIIADHLRCRLGDALPLRYFGIHRDEHGRWEKVLELLRNQLADRNSASSAVRSANQAFRALIAMS